jgi:hypothetical protein
MPEFCLNCNKPLPKGVQSSFCSRNCWHDYKDRRGLAINPERQATVMLKDQSRSLITSLKEEIQKKDEIIQHQDKLIHDYRDSLESRERELLKFQAKIRYYEGVVSELKQQLGIQPVSQLQRPDSKFAQAGAPLQAAASPPSPALIPSNGKFANAPPAIDSDRKDMIEAPAGEPDAALLTKPSFFNRIAAFFRK